MHFQLQGLQDARDVCSPSTVWEVENRPAWKPKKLVCVSKGSCACSGRLGLDGKWVLVLWHDVASSIYFLRRNRLDAFAPILTSWWYDCSATQTTKTQLNLRPEARCCDEFPDWISLRAYMSGQEQRT